MIGKDLAVEELKNLQVVGQAKQELDIVIALKSLLGRLPLLFRAVLSHVVKTVKAAFKDSAHSARRVAR